MAASNVQGVDGTWSVCRHTDFVTALDFHPVDDKFFISGSIDGKVGPVIALMF